MEFFKGPNLEKVNQWQLLWSYLVKAIELLNAAKALAPAYPQHMEAQYLLLGQAVEISLKSFLTLKGVSKDELRNKYGHDLRKLTDECQRQSLGLSPEAVQTIEYMVEPYMSHIFRYGLEGKNGASMPVLEDLLDATDELVGAVQRSIPSGNSDYWY